MFSKEVKKTSELLLCAGPVGAYYLQYVDIDDDIKANMIKVFRLMGILQHKCSTSRDRSKVRKELPIAMTELELRVPTYHQTMVVHVLVSHMVDMLEATGPFHVGNMLDMENYRFSKPFSECFEAASKENLRWNLRWKFEKMIVEN